MRTPAIGILFAILIAERRFKGTTMQIQRHDISSGEGLLRQLRQEQFVDEFAAFDTNAVLCWPRRMGRHHQAAALPTRAHRHVRAVIERADQATFRARELLIGRQVQARLDDRQVKDPIVFASHHEGETEQIGQDGSGPIQPIKPEEGALFWKLMRSQVGPDRLHCSAQLLSVRSVAWIAEGAEPLRGMRLQDGRTATHDFASLAPSVARCTHLIQPTLRERQLWALWQGTLAGSLACAIDVENLPQVPCSIGEPASLLLEVWLPPKQSFEKQCAQSLNWFGSQSGQKAREGRTGRQAISSEERHEGCRKGMQALVERFERSFTAHGVAEEDGHKIDHLIAPEPTPCEAHALGDLCQHTHASKISSDDHRLPKPGGRRGYGVRRGLDDYCRIRDTVHICLLCEESFCSSSSRRHIFRLARYGLHLVAQFVGRGICSSMLRADSRISRVTSSPRLAVHTQLT